MTAVKIGLPQEAFTVVLDKGVCPLCGSGVKQFNQRDITKKGSEDQALQMVLSAMSSWVRVLSSLPRN